MINATTKNNNETVINPKNQVVMQYLESNIKLELHTKTAISLIQGEWKVGKVGLFQFVKLISQIWRAAKEDDPYAEWYLMKLYDDIQRIKSEFKEYEDELNSNLGNFRGFVTNLFQNPTPFEIPLKFSVPFGFMGAFLIENVDYLTRQIFTSNRLGIVGNKSLTPHLLMRKIQRIFSFPLQWKHTGITRKDILENNQKSQKAIQLFGELPQAILNKEIKFSLLPKQQEEQHASE